MGEGCVCYVAHLAETGENVFGCSWRNAIDVKHHGMDRINGIDSSVAFSCIPCDWAEESDIVLAAFDGLASLGSYG